ncbi:MAG: SNF2-related protein, partial [Lachnospiraceae bacterium]|nr:SNF2-related protein [Lachnospiraceae bacterium]
GCHVVRRVQTAVGVSVSSGMLDLKIDTGDIPPEELVELLHSYRQKKKYHRLKNGTFVRMEESSVGMLEEMAAALRLTPKEMIRGNMHLPVYRALYLDRLLEEHEDVYSKRDSHFKQIVKSFKTIKDADFEEPESLSATMRQYQKNGYRWLRTLESWNFGGILADDMGLGKTLQMIAVLLAAKLEGKTGTSLIVTPASLVFNWGEEFKKFAPELKVTLAAGTQAERQKRLEESVHSDVLITSYDLLKRDAALYEGREFLYQVLDEAQYIKNHTTAAAKAVKVIKSRFRFALTGTPIENRLSELWSIFDYLMPGFLYGYDTFRREFEIPVVKNNDQEAMERLQRMVGPFILRRLKQDVLRDLPEKTEEVRYVQMTGKQRKLYDGQAIHLRSLLDHQSEEEFNNSRFQVLTELTRLRQICCDPALCFEDYGDETAKTDACMELVQSAVDGGHRLLVFSQFTSMLDILSARLDGEHVEHFIITGSTPKEKRLQLVNAFNGGAVPVFLISLKAGGVGLNLTGADMVVHYDPWWNLAAQNQATDRAHRIGQQKNVTVYKLITKDSIEEKVLELQETKRELADRIIGQGTEQAAPMTREDMLRLLEIQT